MCLNPETILKPMWITIYKYGIRKIWNKWHRGNIVDNDGILSLNEKDIEEGLDDKNLREITMKYHLHHKKHRYELAEE